MIYKDGRFISYSLEVRSSKVKRHAFREDLDTASVYGGKLKGKGAYKRESGTEASFPPGTQFCVLGTEPRATRMSGKCSTAELCSNLILKDPA